MLTDEIIDMYNECLWSLYTDAKKDLEEFQKSIFKAMNDKLSQFKELARIVVDQEIDGQDLRSMIYGKIASPDAIRSAIKEADKMVLPEDGGHLNFYGNRYSYIRRFAPSFLESFKFYSNITNDPLLAAIKGLRDLNEKRSNTAFR